MNALQLLVLAILVAAIIGFLLALLVVHFDRHEAPDATERPCLVCGLKGDLPALDDSGTIQGYVCATCDHRRRRRRMGWRRRLNARLRKLVKT